MLLAASAIFLAAIAKLVRACMYIQKGIRILNEVGQWTTEYAFEIIELIKLYFNIEAKPLTHGEWLVLFGSLQAFLSSLILLFDSISENLVYLRFADKICSTKIERKPFKLIPKSFL
jgi:hypothetical protein